MPVVDGRPADLKQWNQLREPGTRLPSVAIQSSERPDKPKELTVHMLQHREFESITTHGLRTTDFTRKRSALSLKRSLYVQRCCNMVVGGRSSKVACKLA